MADNFVTVVSGRSTEGVIGEGVGRGRRRSSSRLGISYGFRSLLGCARQNANIFSHKGLVKGFSVKK